MKVKKRDQGPPRWHTRTIHGVTLQREPVNEEQGWKGTVAGEEWRFFLKRYREWQAFTADHLTGYRGPSLKKAVGWVVEYQDEWKAKLRVRRREKTRMVDPVTATKRAS